MCRLIPALLVVLGALSTSWVHAAEAFDPTRHAAVVAPYLDAETFAVVHVDVSRIDVDAIRDEFLEVTRPLGSFGGPAAFVGKVAETWIEQFTKAGGRDLYLVASVVDLPKGGPFLVAPVKQGGSHRQIAGLLVSGRPDGPTTSQFSFGGPMPETAEERGNVVVARAKITLDRLRALKPQQRPDVAAAFAAAGDSAAQLLFVPSDDHRRVFREMHPQLPKELGGISTEPLADGLQWAAVAADLPPRLAVSLVVQSKDAQSATALKQWIAEICRRLESTPQVQKLLPGFDRLSALLTPTVQGDRVRITLSEISEELTKVIAAMEELIAEARERARRSACLNNLKQLGLAMHNYHFAHKRFPAAASYNDEGKKLLSWRVHVLPYAGQQDLYGQFHLDEPWDSEHNRKLISKMPAVFGCVSTGLRKRKEGLTTYLAPLGEQTVFPGKEGMGMRDIKDGSSRTILLVDVSEEHAVIWTRPDDLQVDLDDPLRGLAGQHPGGFNAAMCDGSVHFLKEDIDPKTLRAMFTRSGKDVAKWR